MIDILYKDKDILVCIKPSGLMSESGDNSMPNALKEQTGDTVYPVHRLDTAVSGIIVYALNKAAAADLSRQIQNNNFEKRYLAVIRGIPEEKSGTYTDMLFHDRRTNKSFVVNKERIGVKKAVLDYKLLQSVVIRDTTFSLVEILLHTGRTHQIRVQFASRHLPLYGDGKYGGRTEAEGIALLSYSICFKHTKTKELLSFKASVPQSLPWYLFN